MSKNEEHQDSVATVEAAKEELKSAKEALREFKAEHGVKRGVTPEDPKVAAELAALEEAVEAARTALDEAKEAEKESRPRKTRTLKYEYPEGMTKAEMKKFRAKKRREAKKAAEPEKPTTEEKKSEGDEKNPAEKTGKKKLPPKKKPEVGED